MIDLGYIYRFRDVTSLDLEEMLHFRNTNSEGDALGYSNE